MSARRGTATRSAPPAVTAHRPRTRSVIICLAVTMGIGLAYLALAEVVHWDTHLKLFWSGLLLIVLTGAIVENAITLEARSMGQHDPRSGLKPAGKSARPLPSRRSKPTAYVRHTAGGGRSAATVIAGSKQILDSGTITQAEYDKLKAKALA